MKILDHEKIIGIEVFLTKYKGIRGKLRSTPQDFYVEEISKFPKQDINGKYSIVELSTINWETNHLIKELSNKLHISRKRISFAGTKDKRSKSIRLMSFHKISENDINNINLKDANIKYIYNSNEPVRIGNLIGNIFDINIKDVNIKNIKNIDKIYSYLKDYGGFPNFFGIQRFGAVRPITHIVGKYIVKGDFQKAIMSYIANPVEGEDKLSYNLRKELEKTNDYSSALKNYPNHLSLEKCMLNKLITDSNDFISPLMELPNNLQTMFIYAYQSYLFNKIISKRISNNIPLNKAIIGDIIFPIKNNEIDVREIPVNQMNIDKVNKEISKGKACVTAVLFGSHSNFSNDEMGEIEHNIIDEEKIDYRDFIIPEIPYLSSKGSRRAILSNVKNFSYKIINDSIDKNKYVNIRFELKKGCYATSLLREFMKADDIKNY